MTEKEARIIFFGTPEIAAYQLEKLIEEGYKVVCVVTQPDKPSGRGQKLSISAVKQTALEHGLPVLQPEKLNTEEFEAQIRSYSPDMQIVMAYRMIPERIYSIPKYGTFNLHTSLLPQYRGAAPINRAIMNGETHSGITTFLLDNRMDCGKIIHSLRIEISPKMTAGELHDEMMRLSPELIFRTIATLLSENPQLVCQPEAEAESLKPAPKLFKPDMLIDWTKKGEQIVNHIRGLSPYPAAFANFFDPIGGKNYQIKVYSAEFKEKKNESSDVGIFRVSGKDIVEVSCPNGMIQILDLQLSGKKRMKTEEFLRGFKVQNPLLAQEDGN